MKITDEILHKVWAVELEILDVIHSICKKHNLKYSLAYGTLIGAVRHGGFIPWDDDIDLMMPRKDYEKLKRVWKDEAPADYLMMDIESHKDIPNTFAKVVKNNTTFLQNEEAREKSYPKGIFVDIIPGDLVAPKGIRRKIQYIISAVYLLYTRGYASGTKGVIGFIEKVLLKMPREKQHKWRQKAGKSLQKWNDANADEMFFVDILSDCKKYHPADMFDNLSEISFCGKKYNAVASYDRYLTTVYGDYMQLPPEENRVWRHHPIVIDFEHNYEDLE